MNFLKYISAVAAGIVTGTFAFILTKDYVASAVVFSATVVAISTKECNC